MNVWKKGIKNFQPPVLPSSIETLNNILLENEVRKLQKYGVEIFGMRYNSEDLMNIAKKHGFSIKVDVFYNPDDISTVKVLDPDSKTYVKARCEQYAYIKDGLSLSDHNLVKSEVRKAGYTGKTITETMLVKARRDLYAAIQKAVEKNTKKTKSVRHKQDQERKKTSADVDGSLKPLAPKVAPKVRDEDIRENINFDPVVF